MREPDDTAPDLVVEVKGGDGVELPAKDEVVLECPTLEDVVNGADVRAPD